MIRRGWRRLIIPRMGWAVSLLRLASHSSRSLQFSLRAAWFGFLHLMDARFLLWLTTREREHLEESHRLLVHLRDHAPEEYRVSMIEKVPLNRDVMAAWQEHHGGA